MRDTTNEYEFQEYPKWVQPPVGAAVIVNDEDEEAEVMATGELAPREEDERVRLYAVAEVTGTQIDKRWSLERIAKAIEDAGHDSTANPFA